MSKQPEQILEEQLVALLQRLCMVYCNKRLKRVNCQHQTTIIETQQHTIQQSRTP